MHLLWIVKDLRINERTLFSNEQAFTRLKADAYFSADGTAYQFVAAFDTVIRRGGVDLTGWHGQFIASATTTSAKIYTVTAIVFYLFQPFHKK